MVREGASSRSFPRPFHVVAAVFFQRYPNPFSTHVLTEDVISRQIDPATGCLHTLRLMTKTNKKPKWMDHWLRETVAYVVEETIVDPKAQTIMSRTRNITLASYMCITEWNVFKPAADGTTTLNTHALIRSSLVIGRMVEAFGLQRYQSNVRKAAQGLQWAIDNRHEALMAPTGNWVPRRVDTAIGMVLGAPKQAA